MLRKLAGNWKYLAPETGEGAGATGAAAQAGVAGGQTAEMIAAGQAPDGHVVPGGDMAGFVEIANRALELSKTQFTALAAENAVLKEDMRKQTAAIEMVRNRFERSWDEQAEQGFPDRNWVGGTHLETKVLGGVADQIKGAFMRSAGEFGGKMSPWMPMGLSPEQVQELHTRDADFEEDTANLGGQTTPTLTHREILRFQRERGLARLLCRPFPIAAGQARITSLPSLPTAYYTSKGNNPSAHSTFTFGTDTVDVATLLAVITMSEELEEDSVVNWMEFWTEVFFDVFSLKESGAVFSETATDTNSAFTGIVQAVAAAAANNLLLSTGKTNFSEVGYDDLVTVQNQISSIAREGAVWVCSQAAFRDILRIKDSNEFPLIGPAMSGMPHPNPAAAPEMPRPTTLLGAPLYVTEAMPSDTDTPGKAMLMYGNLRKGQIFGVRSDMDLSASKEAVFESAGSMVRARERYVTANILTAGFATLGPAAS